MSVWVFVQVHAGVSPMVNSTPGIGRTLGVEYPKYSTVLLEIPWRVALVAVGGYCLHLRWITPSRPLLS